MPVLFLAATGMAAFLDFSIGTLIVFTAGSATGVEIQVWHIAIGGILALLPDFDLIVRALLLWLTGRRYEGDHRASVMHAPLIMLPTCTLLGWFLGGSFWAMTTFLCLFYHYVHDSRIFSVGDINWLWPLTNRKLPWMDQKEWFEQFWLRPTKTSVAELCIGVTALGYVVSVYVGPQIAMALAAVVVFINIATWTFYRCIR